MSDNLPAPAKGASKQILTSEDTPTALLRSRESVDTALKSIGDQARAQKHDPSTPKGRKAIASLAYQIARSKTAFDAAGKSVKASAQAEVDRIDAERRRIREYMDNLAEEIRQPLKEWEAQEKQRVASIEARLGALINPDPDDLTSDNLREAIKRVRSIPIDGTWDEYMGRAAIAKDSALTRMEGLLENAIVREREAEELARLREEAKRRQEADERAEAAERAEKARIQAREAEAERQRIIEAEKETAARRAAEEAAERARAEAERVQRQHEAEKAEAKRRWEAELEAERRKVQEAAERREREKHEAEAARRRAEREAKEQAEARKADAEYRAKIRNEISRDVEQAASGAKNRGAAALQIADALINGQIAHTTTNF